MRGRAWPWIVSLVLFVPLPAGATEVEGRDLVTDPRQWDGRHVVISGELVGDYSWRDDGVWVQVNDDSFVRSPAGRGGPPDATNVAVGARIPHDVFREIHGEPGRYGRHGPVVRLEGIFLHADPDLQGETYLAVEHAETLVPAEEYRLPGPDRWLPVGIALLLVSGLVTWSGKNRAVGRTHRETARPGS